MIIKFAQLCQVGPAVLDLGALLAATALIYFKLHINFALPLQLQRGTDKNDLLHKIQGCNGFLDKIIGSIFTMCLIDTKQKNPQFIIEWRAAGSCIGKNGL